MRDEGLRSNQLSVISYQLSVFLSPKSPIPQFLPGGDLIDLGIEAKADRLCNKVSFGAPIPQVSPDL